MLRGPPHTAGPDKRYRELYPTTELPEPALAREVAR
jgi:hypothetical protein